jgi:hypothetical protein
MGEEADGVFDFFFLIGNHGFNVFKLSLAVQ